MTFQELINGALRSLGVIASGESPSTEESNDGLVAVNDLIASWTALGLPIYQLTRDTTTLTGAASYSLSTRPTRIKSASVMTTATITQQATIVDAAAFGSYKDRGTTKPYAEVAYYEDGYPTGKIHLAPMPTTGGTLEVISSKSVSGGGRMQIRETFSLTGAASYSIGVGGTFSSERPLELLSVGVSASSTINKPLVIVSAERWSEQFDRGASGTFGDVLFCDYGYPSATIWIAPKASAGTLELWVYRPLGASNALSDTVTLPPGYERALRFNLALDLAGEYGRQASESLVASAGESKEAIAGLNRVVLGESEVPQPKPSTPPPPPAAPQQAA